MQTKQKPFVYQELVDLIAGSAPDRVLAFRLSSKAARRVETLVRREKEDCITATEQDELNTYMHLSRILMLAQAQAYKILHGTHTPQNS